MKESQTNQEIEQQARVTQLEEQNEAIVRDLAESVQREKEAAQDILDLSDKLLVANKNLDGYGKEKTATIFLKPGERPVIDLVGHWAARDWASLNRQFLETVRRQPKIMVDQEPTEEELTALKSQSNQPATVTADQGDQELFVKNIELKNKELVSVAVITRLTSELKEVKLKLKNKSKRKT